MKKLRAPSSHQSQTLDITKAANLHHCFFTTAICHTERSATAHGQRAPFLPLFWKEGAPLSQTERFGRQGTRTVPASSRSESQAFHFPLMVKSALDTSPPLKSSNEMSQETLFSCSIWQKAWPNSMTFSSARSLIHRASLQ